MGIGINININIRISISINISISIKHPPPYNRRKKKKAKSINIKYSIFNIIDNLCLPYLCPKHDGGNYCTVNRSNLLPMCSAARKKKLNSGTPQKRRIKFVQTADFERLACKYGGPSRKAYFRLAFLYARHRRQPYDTAIKINPPSNGRSPLEKAAFIAVKIKNRTKRHQQPQSVYMSAENYA